MSCWMCDYNVMYIHMFSAFIRDKTLFFLLCSSCIINLSGLVDQVPKLV